jgi:hypothetical protein
LSLSSISLGGVWLFREKQGLFALKSREKPICSRYLPDLTGQSIDFDDAFFMDARIKRGHDALRGRSARTRFAPQISHYRPTTSMCWPKLAPTTRAGNSVGESGMYLLAVFRAIRAALSHRRYRPELHYMRGPGPKWFERHGR